MSIYARQDRKINAVVFNGTPYGSVIVDNRVILAPLFNFGISADGESCTVSPGRDHYEGELEIPATYAGLPVRLLSGFEGQNLEKVTALSGTAFTSDYCFSECTDLQEIYGITGAGRYAFQNCYNLYKIGATMYHLSEGSFYGCMALSEITLGNGIGAIPFNCFYGCDNLTTVYFLGTEYEWNGIVIQEGNEALTNAEIIFHEHTYSDWEITKNPGCGTEGEEERTCSGCGAKEIHTIEASDHAWGEWNITLEATCTANGEEKRYCPQCKTYDTRYTPALDHDLGEPYTYIEPTCKKEGEKRRVCQREGCDYFETSSIAQIGHTWGEWVLNTSTNKDIRKCSGCGRTEERPHQFSYTQLTDKTYSVKARDDVTLEGNIVIPSTYKGKAVTQIAKNGFARQGEIVTVIIPEGVTSIDARAFYGCSNLVGLVIPKSVTNVGDLIISNINSVFDTVYYCGTEEDWANVTIGETNYELEDATFYYYSKEEPMEDGDYWHYVDGKPEKWSPYYKYYTYIMRSDGYSVELRYKMDLPSEMEIPSYYRGEPITHINQSAFYGADTIISVTIPDTVTIISMNAFRSCENLKGVVIPNKVTHIAASAFRDCINLERVVIGESVAYISRYAFSGCTNLTEIVTEGNNSYKFEDGCLVEIATGKVIFATTNSTIPSTATSIGEGAYYGNTYFAPIKIPLNIIKIESNAFGGKPVTVNVEATSKPSDWADDWCDDNVTVNWGYLEVFEKLQFTAINSTEYAVSAADENISGDIVIPSEFNGKRVTKVNMSGFADCKNITSVVIREGIYIIEEDAFRGCDNLKKVITPDSMRSIHAYAFAYCSSLECFVLSKDIELIGAYALPNDLGRDYIYYKGSNDDFAKVVIGEGNGVRVTTIYYYSDFYPTGKLKYWRYVDGEIVVWDVIEDDGSCSHTYGGWTITVTPTCTRLGRMERRCSACGYVDIEMIPVLKHIYEEAIIEPTCTEKGYATYTCSRCKHSYTETISALDHDWDKGFVRIEPTCTSNGVRRHTCTRCGVTIDTGISALRHDWGEWRDVHPAECEIEGTRESTCTRCGETETRVIPATGHDWDTEVEIVEPTCTKGGYTIHTCNACGATRKDNFTGALGHNYVDGICTRCNNDKRGVVYYGVSAIPERYNSSFILGLDHKAASDSHLESISVTPLADEYIYYCSPTAFGDCAFSYNNFVGGFSLIVEGISVTNSVGKTEAYNIYKSNQANLGANGAITITITEKG